MRREHLYSSMRFLGDGVTKVVALTFDLRKGDTLAVDFGRGLIEEGYIIDFDSKPVLVVFSEPLPKGATITIRRRTEIGEVPHIFQDRGNAKGGADFNSVNVDENFEQITRASQDAMDSQLLASETLEEMAGIREDAESARDKALDYSELARRWATNPLNEVVSNGQYSAMHWALKAKEWAGEGSGGGGEDKHDYRPSTRYTYKPLQGYEVTKQDMKGKYYFEATQVTVNTLDGRYSKETVSAKAPYVGTGHIVFADNKVTISRYANVPMTGVHATLPMHDVVGYTLDRGNLPTPFILGNNFDVGKTQLRYIGNHPTHTNLRGSLRVALRVSDDNAFDRRIKGYRELRSPEISLYINRLVMKEPNEFRTYGLSRTFNRDNLAPIKLDSFGTEGASDLTFLDYWSLRRDVPDSFTKLNYVDVSGFIEANSVQEELTYYDDAYTTEWLSTGGYTKLLLERTSKAPMRIQYRDINGVIHCDSSVSNNSVEESVVLWHIPPSAMEFRIYYKSSVYKDAKLDIYGLNKAYDTFFGSWYLFDLDFDRPFSFEPQEVYEFKVQVNRTYGLPTSFNNGDMLLISADMSFNYNVANEVKGKGVYK